VIELAPGNLREFYERLVRGRPPGGVDPRTFRLSQIVAGPEALEGLVGLATAGGNRSRVVIVQDETEFIRAGVSVKPVVRQAFETAGIPVHVVVVPGADVHTTPDRIAAVRGHLQPGDVVIALGSGTITDITKHAVHLFETGGAALHLIAVQSADSVCAYTSGMAVLTIDGVKRTVPSRLPNRLVLDWQLLAGAPAAYTAGGTGDAAVAAVSFADYRLAHLLGLGDWEPAAWTVMEPARTRFLARAPLPGGPAGYGVIGLDLAACGLAMTVAGESAPLSGLEHVTSHMLDMAAGFHGRPVGNHGSQCALATLLSLIAWEVALARPRWSDLSPDWIRQDKAYTGVLDTFTDLDDTGAAWRECWRDFSAKLADWQSHRAGLAAFARNWTVHRDDLRRFTAPPADYVAALRARGHPLRWEDIPAGITPEMARWAFANAHLMRRRTSVADLFAFAGAWDDQLIDRIFDTYDHLTGRPR